MKVRLGRFTQDPYKTGIEPLFELFEAEGSGNVFPSLTKIPLTRHYNHSFSYLTDDDVVGLIAISLSPVLNGNGHEIDLYLAKFDIDAKTVEETSLGRFRGKRFDTYSGDNAPFIFENKIYLSLAWYEEVEGFGNAEFSVTRIVTIETDGTFSVSKEFDFWSSQEDEEAKASTFKNFRQQALAKNIPLALSYDRRYRFIGDPNNQSDYLDDEKWEAAVLITDRRLGSVIKAPSPVERYLSEGAWQKTEAASLLGRTLLHLDREGESESEGKGVTSTLSVNTLNDDFSVDEPVVVATVNFYVNWDDVSEEQYSWLLHNFMPGFSRPMVPPNPERTSVFCMGYRLDGDGFSHSFTFVDIGTGETLCMPAYLTYAYIDNSYSRSDMIDLSAPSLSSIKKDYFFASYIKTYELP